MDELRQASHLILLRFLFIRLLENYGQESHYVLGRLYKAWEDAFRGKGFRGVVCLKPSRSSHG